MKARAGGHNIEYMHGATRGGRLLTGEPNRPGYRTATQQLHDELPERCPQCGNRATWPDADGEPTCTKCGTVFHRRGR